MAFLIMDATQLRRKIQECRAEMAELARAEKPDFKTIEALHGEVTDFEGQLHDLESVEYA